MTFFATFSFDGCGCAPENDDQHSVHTILSDPSRGIFPLPNVRPPLLPARPSPVEYNKYQDLPRFEDILIN